MGVDGDVVADVGVAFDALHGVAVGVDLEGFGPEGHALVDFDVVADGRGLADHHTGAVVDEKVFADARAGVEIGAGAFVGVFGEHAGQKRHAEAVEFVGEALQRDDQDAGVGQDDLLGGARGGISGVGGLDVGLDDAAQLGQAGQHGVGDFRRLEVGRGGIERAGGVGGPGEAERFLQVGAEAGADFLQPASGHGRDVFATEGLGLEEAREKQVHDVRGEAVDRGLGGQVAAVEVVDAALGFVGAKQSLERIVEGHARGRA